ncbi:MAG: hypothetical protein WAM75_21305, partial [Xanthobacteraceae bacterium]
MLRRLMHAHAGDVKDARAFAGGRLEEFGLGRRVDDVGSPMLGLKRAGRQRISRKSAHAGLRCIDHAIGASDLALDIAGEAAARGAVVPRDVGLQCFGACHVAIVQHDNA